MPRIDKLYALLQNTLSLENGLRLPKRAVPASLHSSRVSPATPYGLTSVKISMRSSAPSRRVRRASSVA